MDGAYTSDPLSNPKAKKFDKISYLDVLNRNLKVMDATAISLCRENNIPIIIFNLLKKGNLQKIISGKKIGTVIK